MHASTVVIFFLYFVNGVFSLIPIPLTVNYAKGSIWPKPTKNIHYNSFFALKANTFNFTAERYDCDIIYDAMNRYRNLIFDDTNTNPKVYDDQNENSTDIFLGHLEALEIELRTPCEIIPSENMDERYELSIVPFGNNKNKGLLVAQSVWGILRGMETFSQLVVPINGHKHAVRSSNIVDGPRFPHRGLLIDTARHYLPIKAILHVLDAMSYSKLNVLHWHIVDDQSFPYQSATFPILSEKGSYEKNIAIYSPSDIERVIEHARLRGIRVIPEFDTPGHTLSWGKGIPSLLTKCGDSFPRPYGPIDPTDENNYVILEKLFKEVHEVFPDQYLHLGGDEVEFGCWQSSTKIKDFMRQNKISSFTGLESYYIYKLLNITNKLDAKSIVWQEVYDNNVPLRKDTIVHVWKGDHFNELDRITSDGHPALLSTCWYLDALKSGGDWERFYTCTPTDFEATDQQKKLILGGEACMWGEDVDETNIQPRIWPRACAVAEILWSGGKAQDASKRIEEHVCRLKKRGIAAQPANGPAFCPYAVV